MRLLLLDRQLLLLLLVRRLLLLLQQLQLLMDALLLLDDDGLPRCYPERVTGKRKGKGGQTLTPLTPSLAPIIIINNYTKILLMLKTKKELRPLLLYSLPTRYYCSKNVVATTIARAAL